MKKLLGLIIVIIAVILIIRMSSSGTPQVTVGGFFNLTGYAAFAGEPSRDGFIMAVEDANLATGTVKTVIEDAGSDLKQAVSGATKLIQIDKSIVVIGPEWTEFGEVVAPVAVANKVPFISPWIVAEVPFVKPPYYWSASPSYRSEHAALAKYLATHKLVRISLVYSNNAWSYADMKMFKEEIAAYPEIHVISEQGLDQSTKDFRTVIAKIKTDKPDLIYSAIAEDEGYGAFMAQVRQSGIMVPLSTFSSRATSSVLKDRYSSLLTGQIFAESVPPERTGEFEAKYEKRFGRKVGAISAAATYDMTTLVLGAIKGGARTSEDVIAYLESMPAYEGYSGLISYDKDGRLPLRKAVIKRYNTKGVAEVIE